MKTILRTLINPGDYPKHVNIALFILRVVIACFMLTHGWSKLEMLLSGEPIVFPDPIGLGKTTALFLAVFAEVGCSLLLILGLGTRFAAIPLLITMLIAAYIVHANDGFGKQEFALLYGLVFLTLLFTGGGKYSLDYLLSQKSTLQE